MGSQEWRRFVAPAAFLLAVTIAVVLVHSGIESGGGNGSVTIPAAPSSAPKRVATSTTSTTTAKPAAPTRRFWTVRAGDTFGVISAASGVPVATIEQLNPKASSTSLFIGEKLRLR